MVEKLNVLVLESERGAAAVARDELTQAGHTVLMCHEPGRAAFPCNALAEGHACPFESSVVDVALDVRPRPRSQPGPQEDGVSCALRFHVPVVIAGSDVMNPYADYATDVLNRTYDVVAACERAAHVPLLRHSAAAVDAMRAVLERRGIASDPEVVVRRRNGALVVEIDHRERYDEPTKNMASVRITAAVRGIDPYARGIDVVFLGR
jgi:hypothetical protein